MRDFCIWGVIVFTKRALEPTEKEKEKRPNEIEIAS
jgi:hypothetical protein